MIVLSKKVTQPGVSVVSISPCFRHLQVILSSSLSWAWDNFSQMLASWFPFVISRARALLSHQKCVYPSTILKYSKKARERSLAPVNNWEQCHSSFTSAVVALCMCVPRGAGVQFVDSEKGRVPARRISELLGLVERTQCARFVMHLTQPDFVSRPQSAW